MRVGQLAKCIRAEDKAFITEGRDYKINSIDGIYVRIKDDRGEKGEYHKTRFKTNKHDKKN
jgi:hypothetical protein